VKTINKVLPYFLSTCLEYTVGKEKSEEKDCLILWSSDAKNQALEVIWFCTPF